MPKIKTPKRNGSGTKSPYGQDVAAARSANPIFRMNTDIGQHVLKNPGVAQAIVDKANLKQSDVNKLPQIATIAFLILHRLFLKLGPGQVT